MILFILGLVIGSIGGMIMMAIFMTGKTRESSFHDRIHMRGPSNTPGTGGSHDNTDNHGR